MSSWQSLHYLNLLWLLFPLVGLFIAAHWRRQTMLRRLANPAQAQRLAQSTNGTARVIRAVLFTLALAAVVIALARPSWNKSRQPFKNKGRDVVFILDISRSMLAAHRNTTRLEEAKFAIQECLSTVRGDRVALIIFAGNAKVACPLTHDYAYFLAKLSDVDYRSVTFGGTMLGDAVRLACSSIFKTRAQLYRDVIVITDGEDMESNPVQAAEQLADLNARLIVVGMGDSMPTPLVINTPDGGKETITDNGSPVMTKLDIDTLRKMTEATPGGVLIPVPSDTMLNLNDIYRQYIDMQVKKDFETHSVVTYEEKYQLFLAIAMILLTVMLLIPERRRLTAAVATLLLAFQILPADENTPMTEISSLVTQAKQQIEAKDIEAAKTSLKKALELQPDSPLVNYNVAALDYIQGNYKDAVSGFQRALSLAQSQNFDVPGFKEKAHLGIAASSYRMSQKEDNQNPQPDAELAVRHFKDALDCNPQNMATRDNLNTAKLNYKTIRQRMKQQQQQNGGQNDKDNKKDNQNDDQKDGQQQASGKENQDDKKQDGNDEQKKEDAMKQALQDLEKQQRQAAQDMKDSGKSQEDLQKQQENLQKQAQDALDKQQQQNKQSSSDDNQSKKAEDFMKESLAKQKEAKEHLDKDERQQAQQAQKDAADLTSMARQTLDQQQPQKQPQEQPKDNAAQQQAEQQPEQQRNEQPKQTDARAMDAINQENINRLNRQRKAFNAPAVQNKDW